MNRTETHLVPKQPIPIRLQEYGVGIFNAALTKSALKKALKKQLIRVNESIATTATFISGGESITLTPPEKVHPKKKLIFPLEVVFEDEYLAAVHKPAGILVSGNHFKTITNALGQNLKPSNLSDATTPQPVHRLDYATTGILLAGKTSSSIRSLNKLFENKVVEKTYYAITIGAMEATGEITIEIEGRLAVSSFKLVDTVPSKRFDKLNLVQLKPQTGRRHQLRIHLAGIGNPILGDRTYGSEHLILKGKGMYLHAYSLEFEHPISKEKLFIKTELPMGFKKIFPEFNFDSLNSIKTA